MPKRNKKNRSKRMRGGWPWDSASGSSSSSSGTGWFSSLKKNASSSGTGWFSSTPAATPAATPAPAAATPPATPPPAPVPAPAPVTGGRKRRSHRMRGGYSNNMSTTNLAASAGSFSGSTARAQAYVGGRTKKRCHTHKRSHRRHCRK